MTYNHTTYLISSIYQQFRSQARNHLNDQNGFWWNTPIPINIIIVLYNTSYKTDIKNEFDV